MANKSLNSSLDAHLSKVREGAIKVVGSKKNRKTALKKCWDAIKAFFMKIKNYFFPSASYEQATFSGQGVAVVIAIDKGFKKHFKAFCRLFKKPKHAPKKVIEEEPDMDISAVNDVIKKNKL